MLPLAVLLPTRNAMAFLPDHVNMMRKWLDLVEEVVVVDSSWDDSLAYLEKELAGFNVRFLRHPAGLYQSWNSGINLIRSRYVYISTAGDSIHRAGLKHLVEVAEREACDVVVSPPDLLTETGRPFEGARWPVHHIISFLDAREPVCFEGIPLFFLAMSFFPGAILGSSASNIYRTKTLQENPFPTGFGTVGDTAWCAENAFKIRFGVSPLRSSSFIHHPKTYPLSEYAVDGVTAKLYSLALAALNRAAEDSPEISALAQSMNLSQSIRSRIDFDRWRARLTSSRQGSVPWFVKPGAWAARVSRDAAAKRCWELTNNTTNLNGYRRLVDQCLGHFVPKWT
ncbi:MAG TPA: glycosyltransferase [Chthoniobacteraceae bacterium]|nr:glycosyltransferase [Chthoniobacteraceae bacterium]